MRVLIYFIAVVILVSCNKKEEVEPVSSPGFLEGYLKANSRIGVSEVNEPNVNPHEKELDIYRGYYIVPSSNIKINALGARMPEKGTYEITVTSGALWDFVNRDHILVDSITIGDTSKFQFKSVDQGLALSANNRYLIAIKYKKHNSVYEAKYQDHQPNGVNSFLIPLVINDIEIESLFYHGTRDYYPVKGGIEAIRGLVDFKYELIK
ncbi:hypothetical protein DXT99_04980 [Pontibacter diazotrophicus]|uniref:DUF4082 domain-containing protein n=1 Tax=Pontibacter diazotrophicus TaxID=1400979 RepID=A0A3D8LGG4_9BACT|nr:hypothetical protein [Pontibacter diazotrophicus]RDV16549.1 hypothetical protein DXT99_04980 [Pontibacter diazotrophicus]